MTRSAKIFSACTAKASITETSTYDGDGVRVSRQVGTGPVIRAVTDPTAGLPVTIDDGSGVGVFANAAGDYVTNFRLTDAQLRHFPNLGGG